MDDLEIVREGEEGNYQETRRGLGDAVSLVQDVVDLYGVLGELLKGSPTEVPDEIVVASQFVLAARYQLTIGALTLLRGHLTDSFSYARQAIELCAFAARVKRNADLAMVWLNAGDSDAAYKEYRKKFSPGELFPEDDAILRELRERYDFCSKQFHPSLYSLARRIETEQIDEGFKINFGYFELDREEPICTLLWTLDTHFRILGVFEDVYSEIIAYDRARWDVRRNAVEGKLLGQKAKWKAVCLGKSELSERRRRRRAELI